MMTVFRDAKGALLKDYLSHGNMINGWYYARLLIKPRKTVTRKRVIVHPNMPKGNMSSHTVWLGQLAVNN